MKMTDDKEDKEDDRRLPVQTPLLFLALIKFCLVILSLYPLEEFLFTLLKFP